MGLPRPLHGSQARAGVVHKTDILLARAAFLSSKDQSRLDELRAGDGLTSGRRRFLNLACTKCFGLFLRHRIVVSGVLGRLGFWW